MIFTLSILPDEYLAVVGHIDVLRQQLRYATSDHRRRWTGFLRRSTFARAVQGSNSIEGYHVTDDDAVAAVDEEQPFDAEAETWMAVSGYRAAMSYVLQLADDPHYQHNEGTLKGLHYMMVGFDLQANPGRWRPGPVWVTHQPGGKTVYDGPDVKHVPALMQELIASLNAQNHLPVMVRAAMAHLNLVMIHPFSDGNGRMGRALQTMVLAREGFVDPVFSSIEEYLGRNAPEYYDILGAVGQGSWHPEHDALPWIKFSLNAHYQQAVTLVRRTKETELLWNQLESELKRRRLNERMVLALADAAVGFRVRNSTYRKSAAIKDQVAGKDLRLLVRQGLLEPQGDKKWRYYVASKELTSIRTRTREKADEPSIDPFELPPPNQPLQPSLRGFAGPTTGH